jgi:hypothetical protein
MRNLQAAALFAIPIAAAPVATSSSSELNPTSYSEVVSLPLAVGEDGFEIVSLRLDVHATDKACDPSAVSINGIPLSHDGKASGSGSLTLEDGQPITAEWYFTCDDPSQFLDMTILSFDGDDIPHVSFSTHLLYSPESEADAATVGQPQVNDTPSSEDDASAMRELRHTELQANLDRLGQLRVQAAELKAKIKQEESAVDVAASEYTAEDSSTSVKDCTTTRCMWRALKDKIKAAMGSIRDKALGAHESDDHTQAVVQIEDNADDQPLTDDSISQSAPSEDQSSHWFSEDLRVSPEFAHEALLGALFVAIVGFSLFTLLRLTYKNRDRIRAHLAERRARRRGRWPRTWSERRAARAARRQAIRDFVCGLFRSLVDYDAEKRAAEEERRQALAERQAEEGQRRTQEQQDEQETTMEQELAGFRVAAALVDDLVSGRRPVPQQQELQPRPVPPRPPISGFVTYDDRLPTYEEQIHDSAVVADGFRYEPGLRSSERQHLPTPERSSDRLGYDK